MFTIVKQTRFSSCDVVLHVGDEMSENVFGKWSRMMLMSARSLIVIVPFVGALHASDPVPLVI